MNTLSKSILVVSSMALGWVMMSTMFASQWQTSPEVQAAIQADDYSLLSAEMQEKISSEKFEKLSDRHALHDAVKSAIQAGDYNALPEAAQEKIDQEKFTELVGRHQQHEETKAAIDAGDYTAFVAVADEKMLDKIDSKETFDELLAKKAEKELMKAAVETAVADNDFDAFAEIVLTRHGGDTSKPTPTTEKLQEHFEKLQEYYTEYGELPEHKGQKGMKKWWNSGAHQWGDRGRQGDEGQKRGSFWS